MMDAIRNSLSNTKGFYNAILESDGLTSPDVKDMFLDDPDAIVIGAENDPEVAKFVDSIPVDDEDAKDATEADIKKIVESMDTYFNIGEAYEGETDEAINGKTAENDFSAFDDPDTIEESYESEMDSAIDDRVTSENDLSTFDDPDTLEGCVKESDDDIDEDDTDDDFDAFDE